MYWGIVLYLGVGRSRLEPSESLETLVIVVEKLNLDQNEATASL